MKNKLMFQNPVTLLFLGAAPALAASASVIGALAMSAAVLGVLLCSALVLGILGKLIGAEAKLPAAVLAVAGFASIAQLLGSAFLPSAFGMLGLYAAVLAVDLMIFGNSEDTLDNGIAKGLLGALVSGLCFAVFALLLAAIRELFGAASFAGVPVDALKDYRIALLGQSSGGLIVFGILLAVVNKLFPARDGAGELTRAVSGLAPADKEA